ncbi:MAG: GNAT family N-acetyltransferase [Planctomyces sp.]|nr:GNAT family N-acetyltransferase [Planctomyces sp.]
MSALALAVAERRLIAHRDGDVVGTIGVVPQPHGIGLIFPPQVVGGEEQAPVERLLIQGAVERLRLQGVALAQVVLADAERELAARFGECGFRRLTTALILERELLGLAAGAPPSGALRARACDPERDRADLVRLIERIGVGSLDCPELDPFRPAAAQLDGHRAACAGGASAWWTYAVEGTLAGAAFCAVFPETQTCELLFFGVAPEFRGRGLGRGVLEHVCAVAAGERLHLRAAVDSRNSYARSAYAAAGFRESDSVEIWVHSPGPTS